MMFTLENKECGTFQCVTSRNLVSHKFLERIVSKLSEREVRVIVGMAKSLQEAIRKLKSCMDRNTIICAYSVLILPHF